MQARFLLDPYEKEFTSEVVSVQDKCIVLQQTAFYPNSGGQPHDLGTLTTEAGKVYQVIYVAKVNGQIIHEVDNLGLHIGQKVTGKIDWNRRYQFMRYHTAAHILSTLIHRETGAEITGNQLGLDKSRVDFSLAEFDRVIMTSFQEKVNDIVQQGLPVNFKLTLKDEAFKIPELFKLRKAFDESIKTIRLVEISGFDIQACGGCHIKNTKEIGSIEITKLENKGKDRKRIYFTI